MAFDLTFRAADAAIVLATLAGPVLAVQAQKYLERRRVVKERQLQIFRALMATRAGNASAMHVEAVNAVPVEFYGNKPILDEWSAFLDHLNKATTTDQAAIEQWAATRLDRYIDLLYAMSKYFGYGFNKTDLKNSVYRPRGHAEEELDQQIIRKGFAKLLSGDLVVPMALKEFPTDQRVVVETSDIRQALISWLDGKRSVRVEGP